MKRLTAATLGLLAGLSACEVPPGEDSLAGYAAQQAQVFDMTSTCDELGFLADLADGADVIGLGEARHDGREFFLLKAQLIRCLITAHGVRHLVLEEGFSSARAINADLQSESGDLHQSMNRMSNWFIWDTEEVYDLLNWIRQFNQNRQESDQVRFYGMDMTAPLPAIENIVAVVRANGAASEEEIESWLGLFQIFDTPIWAQTARSYHNLSEEGRQQLLTAMEHLSEAYESVADRTSPSEQAWLRREMETILQAHEMYVLMASDYVASGNMRDAAMAANVGWLGEQAPDAPMIVWSHNLHVAKTALEIDIPGVPPALITPLGALLAQDPHTEYRAVGFSFFESVPAWGLASSAAGSVDEILASVSSDLFYLPLMPARERPWASDTMQMRAQGGQSTLPTAHAFDGLIFVRTIDRTSPTALARARFETMN